MLVEGVVVALAMLWVPVLFWWSLTPCTLQHPVSDHNHEYASPEYVVRLFASATSVCTITYSLLFGRVAPVRVPLLDATEQAFA
jgi:hypothetical protein